MATNILTTIVAPALGALMGNVMWLSPTLSCKEAVAVAKTLPGQLGIIQGATCFGVRFLVVILHIQTLLNHVFVRSFLLNLLPIFL